MENASKALIIAGAILLAILIISLGIMIYNQAAGVVNNNAMSEVEINQFNQKFTQYAGKTVRGATVNALVNSVAANNSAADSEDRQVTISGAVTLSKNQAKPSVNNVVTGATYTVECTMSTSGSNKGLVESITITKN